MIKRSISALLVLVSLSVAAQESLPKYQDPSAPLEERVEDALSRMTLEEKLDIIHAQSKFSSAGVPSLGISELWMTDGPHGIRPEVLWDEWEQAAWTSDSCTAYPALTALAATWNRDMSLLYGRSIGEEARYRKKDVLLGPGVNIYRTPLNGRNFEYMGEDPYLAGEMVVPYVIGVQENGVAACVKHYALNNQEFNRHTSNIVLDDRALYEIYLPAFKAAVQKGGAWAIMGAYNLYNNEHAGYNEILIQRILREEWGFDGAVISDWGGVHTTRMAVENGLDLEFGSWTDGLKNGASNAYDNYYLADPYRALIESGEYSTKELDDKVRNVLRLGFRTAMNQNKPFGSFGSKAHSEAANRIASEGIVLLKNEDAVLPIQLDGSTKVLVVGENAIKMMTVGGGSSSLKARYETLPIEGITALVGDRGEVSYARGYVGDPTGEYNGVKAKQDLSESRSEDVLIAEAVEMAKSADYVIFVGGLNKAAHQDCEDSDRAGLELPYTQDRLLSELSKVNDKVIFVNISGNAVAMPWLDSVPAVVQAWYLGSEAGSAIASVLFGEVNPSGKLPFSFPKRLNDLPAHALDTYPGDKAQLTAGRDTVDVHYAESIFVGYRGLEKEGREALFSFGHGLSYTTFKYGKLELSSKSMGQDGTITATITIRNSGDRAGAEVVQLYIADKKSSLPRPIKELKAFDKVYLEAGESREVTFTIDSEMLSYFDDKAHEWVAEDGTFEVLVGSSSSDIRAKAKFELK